MVSPEESQESASEIRAVQSRRQKGARLLNFGAAAMSFAVFLSFLIGLITRSFVVGLGDGFQSLAASLVPFLVIVYVTFFTRLFRLPATVPAFNLFVCSGLWTLLVLISADLFADAVLPVVELLCSFSLGILLAIAIHSPARLFLSCAYGTVVGLLVFVAFFGLQIL